MIPARDTEEGVAQRKWEISKMSRICGVRAMRSLLASVRILFSSMSVFNDSIQLGSISPSSTIHFGPALGLLALCAACSRRIDAKSPSLHSRVVGLTDPNSSSEVTALVKNKSMQFAS